MGRRVGIDGAPQRRHGVPVDISLSPLQTEQGLLLAAAIRDVTERTRADETLRKSEERFRGLLEAAPDAVVIVAQNGSISLVNSQTEAMFGYTRAELIGEPVETLVPERFRDLHAP